MTTKAKTGLGTKVYIGDGASPEVFTALAEVLTVDGPNPTATVVDATSVDTVGGYDEPITGLKSAGEVTIEMNFVGDDPGQEALKTAFDAGTQTNFRIDYPDHGLTRFSFVAVVIAPPAAKVDPRQVLKGAVKLRVVGAYTVGTHS